jgi:hypothetical protein
VLSLQWFQKEAAARLSMLLLKHLYLEFFNQTKKTVQIALNLVVKHNLGGRDALIIANFIANKIPTINTHDKELYDAILYTLGTTDGKFVCSSTPWHTDSVFFKILRLISGNTKPQQRAPIGLAVGHASEGFTKF